MTQMNDTTEKTPAESTIVTPGEVQKFLENSLRRAGINLVKAEARGDKLAVRNIQRKIAVYKFLLTKIL